MDKLSKLQRRLRKTRAKIRRLRIARLSVKRSLNHIYAQIINPVTGVVLAQASTRDGSLKAQVAHGGNQAAAKLVGALVAERAIANGVKKVAFDRSGYQYHGRVKTLADAAREAGLEF